MANITSVARALAAPLLPKTVSVDDVFYKPRFLMFFFIFQMLLNFNVFYFFNRFFNVFLFFNVVYVLAFLILTVRAPSKLSTLTRKKSGNPAQGEIT